MGATCVVLVVLRLAALVGLGMTGWRVPCPTAPQTQIAKLQARREGALSDDDE